MKTTRLFSIGVIAVAMFAVNQQTSAQLVDFLTSPGYDALINNAINNKIWENSMERYTKGKRDERPGAARSSSSRQTSRAEVPAYRKYPAVQFKPTGTRLTLQEYLGSVNVSAKDKAELKELILSMWDVYETEAARKGYPNDLALALVSCIGLNSHVYKGRAEKLALPFEQNIGQRDVIAEYATDHGTFNSLTDRQKQELYELFVMLGGLTYHFYEKALRENNAEELKAVKLTAANNLKLIGIKP